MSYGLYDCDMEIYGTVPFNLELMKMATYYKKNKEIVSLSPSFSPYHYQHFIYRKDYLDDLVHDVVSYPNIIYGGRAFNPSKYVPLDLEIEKCKPDTTIYRKISGNFAQTHKLREAYNVMRKAEHVRLSLDGKNIWPDFEKQLKREDKTAGILFHDYDLGKIKDAPLAIKEILKWYSRGRSGKRIGMKFPLQINNNEEQLLEWAEIKPFNIYHSIQYNGLLSYPGLRKFLFLSYGTSMARQFTYHITAYTTYDKFIKEDINYLFRQISYLRREGVKMSLKYDKEFFEDERWYDVVDMINAYYATMNVVLVEARKDFIKHDSMYSFACSCPETPLYQRYITKHKARENFQFVRENNYELFKDFYELKLK